MTPTTIRPKRFLDDLPEGSRKTPTTIKFDDPTIPVTTTSVAAQNIIAADNISPDTSIQSNQGVQIGKRKTGVDDFALLLP
ncbi:hypothetical protein CEXT_699791 [Caerostris extrusa]|uniref:Uncharacterized protein n=1 Tax=Caerostris extrusa TaxID=172846 RepID=A0AAV4PQV9_CAEEX|nr:hypothetical protein CEXT_699791 [Caerostris extrusa]